MKEGSSVFSEESGARSQEPGARSQEDGRGTDQYVVGRKPDLAKPTSRPISRRDTTQRRAAPKRSGGGSRRAEIFAPPHARPYQSLGRVTPPVLLAPGFQLLAP